jgi:hypothetical protein
LAAQSCPMWLPIRKYVPQSSVHALEWCVLIA